MTSRLRVVEKVAIDVPCFVYVISITAPETASGLVKVGISEDPKSRLRQLLTGSPFSMRMEHVFKLPNRTTASQFEARFHDFYKDNRTRGEWFDIDVQTAIEGMIFNLHTAMISDGFNAQKRRRAWNFITCPNGWNIDDLLIDDLPYEAGAREVVHL